MLSQLFLQRIIVVKRKSPSWEKTFRLNSVSVFIRQNVAFESDLSVPLMIS